MKESLLLFVVFASSLGGAATHQVADYAALKTLFEGGTLVKNDVIELTGEKYDFTEPLTLPTTALTIRGARVSGERPILDGGGASSGFYPTSDSVFRDLVFTNFNTTGTTSTKENWGSAIRFNESSGTVVSNCLFTHCQSVGSGGAVALFRTTLYDCTFITNTAHCTYSGENETYGNGGGALAQISGYAGSPSLVMTGCYFEGNAATPTAGNSQGGGAILSRNNSIVATNCTFIGNTSTYKAGAVQGVFGVASNVTFIANVAGDRGGATAHVNSGSFRSLFLDCYFERNTVGDVGGALYIHNSMAGCLTLTNCIFRSNRVTNASGYGGAIDFDNRYGNEIVNCEFTDNSVPGIDTDSKSPYAGAIAGGARLIANCGFTNNLVKSVGGAIYWNGNLTPAVCPECVITNCTFFGNRVAGKFGFVKQNMSHAGGAIHVCQGTVLRIDDCHFEGNYIFPDEYNHTHTVYGGAVSMEGRGCSILNCDFIGNSIVTGAPAKAAAVYLGGWTNLLANCRFIGNTNDTLNAFGGAVCTSADSPLAWNTVSNCYFALNYDGVAAGASPGGGIGHYQGGVAIYDCVFSNNTVHPNASYIATGGGAIGHYQQNVKQMSRASNMIVDRCAFYDNSSAKLGGAICLVAANDWNQGGTSPSADYTNQTSFLTAKISNSLFVRNQTGTAGGAIYLNSARDVVVENCTFVSNRTTTANTQGGAVYLGNAYCKRSGTTTYYISTGGVTNCLFFGNTINGSSASVNANIFCNSEAEMCSHDFEELASKNFMTDGTNDNLVRTDPGFANPAAGDYSLKHHSVCENAGVNAPWMTGAFDLTHTRKHPRILYDRVDIGAYELRLTPGVMIILR